MKHFIAFTLLFVVLCLHESSVHAQDGQMLAPQSSDFLKPMNPDNSEPPPFPEEEILDAQQESQPEAEAQEETGIPEDILAPKITPQPETDDAFRQKYKGVPDEVFEEALAFAAKCKSNARMPDYYDCECMSNAYLDERIRRGPDASPSSIERGIGGKCADGTGIAGKLYQRCLQQYNYIPDGQDPEVYCSCYGNTFARAYENLGRSLNSRTSVALMSQARTECRE